MMSFDAFSDFLCRSVLFVPGGDERKLDRAPQAGADVLVYDLEDAVAPTEKERARRQVCDALATVGPGLRLVRVNGLDTPWGLDDIGAVCRAGAQAIMLPKCEHAAQLDAVAVRMTGSVEAALVALIETPAGVLDLAGLGDGGGRLAALAFGHADFCRAMGLHNLRADAGVALHARMQLVLAARARGLVAIDCVCLDVRDAAVFRTDAQLGRDLGYDGKLCIHPAQVALANAVFTPDPAAVARAQRVIDAWSQAQRENIGVIVVDGEMVDAPVATAQQRLLARAQRCGVTQHSRDGAQ